MGLLWEMTSMRVLCDLSEKMAPRFGLALLFLVKMLGEFLPKHMDKTKCYFMELLSQIADTNKKVRRF